ncbi:MAG: hypothetical protein V3U80_02785 [Flavobacteriaceae bacterium]
MKNTLTFILILFTVCTFSQKDPNVYDFFGGKSYDNTTLFFRLVFEINDGKIAGYIFTDEQGSNAEKSIIEGTFNYKTNRISFKETRKLITKASQGFDEMCYVNGNLLLELDPKVSKIKGSFIELNAIEQACRKGEISIISVDSYFRLKDKIKEETDILVKEEPVLEEKAIAVTLNDAQKDKIIIPSFETDKKTVIKQGDDITILWNSDTFKMILWDEEKEDGDKITIEFNEEILLDKYYLKNKKKTINIALEDGENTITFTANTIGRIGSNTARIDLFDDEIKHQIISKLELNESVVVNLQRKTQ